MKKCEEFKFQTNKALELKFCYQCLEELYEFVVEQFGIYRRKMKDKELSGF